MNKFYYWFFPLIICLFFISCSGKKKNPEPDKASIDPNKLTEVDSILIDKTIMDFTKLNIDAIKIDREEAFALTGLYSTDALYKLPVKTVIMTVDNRTLMMHNQHLYEITTDVIHNKDSTGAGDILAGAYTSAFVQTNDAQWALSYGVAASVTALRTNKLGIEKIPLRKDVEEYASTLYNRIRTVTT